MNIPPGGIKIDLLTRSHHYSGYVDARGFRLADILNDSTSSILELGNVLVARREVTAPELRSPRLLVRKSDVLAVFLSGKHEAPVRRSNNRVERYRRRAVVMLSDLILLGIVHLPSRAMADALLMANSLLPAFLGLTDITVHSCAFPMLGENHEVAIIRREWIEALDFNFEPVGTSQLLGMTPVQQSTV